MDLESIDYTFDSTEIIQRMNPDRTVSQRVGGGRAARWSQLGRPAKQRVLVTNYRPARQVELESTDSLTTSRSS